ncbi:hypothetical protein BDM02DRAFT_1930775 [Thelephora ganbajun]|uniref:Uncharacterized protein n=1 Tax=Thelephora ganbajun TaxID=370292 RepID=A0ACB6ZHJ4_THEGA|nr:hypothetical protein BDM02DRAFT_1930775 [Thelephora ganbajun]
MEVVSLDEQQISSGSSNERILKRPRVDEGQGNGLEVPTEQCRKHPLLYLEDGNVVLRCENTLFRFYIGVLSRKSEIFYDMFGLAPIQPTDSEKTVDGLPVVRLYDSAEDFAHLLSALLDYESLFLQKYIQYPRFAALLRLSIKYELEGVHKLLVHRVQKHYPVGMSDYERIMKEHGTAATAAFTLSPHPNEVLKLFWECDVKQCLPVALYEATVRALATFNSKHVDHVRSTLDTVRTCGECRRANLISVEHLLLPARNDLSLSPLRDPGLKSDVARALCEVCVGEVIRDNRAFRYAFWDELPGMFGLPTWRELSEFVILK